MAGKDEVHAYVAFASRHGGPMGEYLNAFSAVVRVESLIEDAEKLSSYISKAFPEDSSRWSFWNCLDVCAYYSVGYVTCLEWHVRSRLVDLFTHKPSALRSTDVQGRLTDKIVPQMVAQNATVAQLIGASTNIGSFQTYMSHMTRIFAELNIPQAPLEWLSTEKDGIAFVKKEDFKEFEELFRGRNTLVHEIGSETIGHYNIRDSWTPERAIELGRLVNSLIQGLERAIFLHGPSDFPNRLTETGVPIPETDMIDEKIISIEGKLLSFAKRQSSHDEGHVEELLKKAIETSAEARLAEKNLIQYGYPFHSRYLDLKTPLLLAISKDRLQYLELMKDMISTHWDIDENIDDKT